MKKARLLEYRGVRVFIVLVKNRWWRWYATTENSHADQQEINFGRGSNKPIRLFAREIQRHIDELKAKRKAK